MAHLFASPALDVQRIAAVSIDLDDTLWPIWPTIHRCEAALRDWMRVHAPATAGLCEDGEAPKRVREALHRAHPELQHDLSELRLRAIRGLLHEAGDDPALAEAGFAVFFAERQRVDLFDDALPALQALSARYPLASLSNGNADLVQVGVDRFFTAALSARSLGLAKPHRRAFEATAEALACAPDQVLHIGDDPRLDVVPALACGMQAVWLNRAGAPWPLGPEGASLAPGHLEVASLWQLCEALGLALPGAPAGRVA